MSNRGCPSLVTTGGSREYLGPRPPPPRRPKVARLPPPPPRNTRSIGMNFVTAFDFFYRYERYHKSLVLPDRLFFSVFLSSKFQNCLRNSKIFLQLDAYASIIDSKPTEIQKRTFFYYIKNINFGHIFDDFGDLPCRWQIGHFFIFSKVNFGSSQKIVA